MPAVTALEQEAENSSFIIPYPLSRHQQVIEDPDEEHLSIFSHDGQMLGFIILAGLKNPHQSLEFRRIVIREKGKGWGRLALKAVKQYCFEKLHCHRLWLDVFSFNERARKLYLSEGFREEGLLRECYKTEEGYKSLVLMSMLR